MHQKRRYQKNSQIRDLARRKYLKSEFPKECAVCGYAKFFDVCHIKDISAYDPRTTVAVINSFDNLIALCKNHHNEFDRGLLKLQGIKKELKLPRNRCSICGDHKNTSRSKTCLKCARISKREKINWPPLDELILKTCATSYVSIGKKLGVSDVAVKKHIRNNIKQLLKRKDYLELLLDEKK